MNTLAFYLQAKPLAQRLVLCCLALFMAICVSAQSIPQGINYQAVVRDANGAISSNSSVIFRFSIREGTQNGPIGYQETTSTNTDDYGMASVVIGMGTPIIGAFSDLEWSDVNYLQVEINTSGQFVDLGTSQFQSVPYALNAETSWSSANTNIFNANLGNVGIGLTLPPEKLSVAGTIGISEPNGLGDRLKIGSDQLGAAFYQRDPGVIIFQTGVNKDERMRISDAGVTMGTTNPEGGLRVVHDVGMTMAAYFQNRSNDPSYADGIYITAGTSNYPMGINSWYALFETPGGVPVGAIIQNGSNSVMYATTSDIRLKSNIRGTHFGLSDMMQIAVSDFNYKDDQHTLHTGFIAQQLEDIYPPAVSKGGDDPRERPYFVDYGMLTPLLVKSIQDQQEQIEELKAEIQLLKER